ncbi:MAG: DUF1211 domain-containing protein [Alphaproteobacteria bacterium]|nr:DUF1211 domain-containing protein [Alphaproteobacteria bacterium]
MEDHRSPEKDYNLERLIFLSDGLFAIVITLLVIELKPPENWDKTFAGLMDEQWRALAAYAVTFLAIGAFWNAHRQMFARVSKFHPGLVVFNLLFLGLVTLLPYAAELLFEAGPRGEPYLIYMGLLAAISLAQAVLWAFAALIANVLDTGLPVRDRAVLFLTMCAPAGLLVYGGWMSTQGRALDQWIWVGPVLAVVALIRRRLTAKAAKLPERS